MTPLGMTFDQRDRYSNSKMWNSVTYQSNGTNSVFNDHDNTPEIKKKIK